MGDVIAQFRNLSTTQAAVELSTQSDLDLAVKSVRRHVRRARTLPRMIRKANKARRAMKERSRRPVSQPIDRESERLTTRYEDNYLENIRYHRKHLYSGLHTVVIDRERALGTPARTLEPPGSLAPWTLHKHFAEDKSELRKEWKSAAKAAIMTKRWQRVKQGKQERSMLMTMQSL